MFLTKQYLRVVRTLGVALVAAVGFTGCVTYDDEFVTINSRLDTIDARVESAAENAAAAAAAAQRANERLDSLENRVDALEAGAPRVPRG